MFPQLSNAIAEIAVVDYPDDWENIVPILVENLMNPDLEVVISILSALNDLFKRFVMVDSAGSRRDSRASC